MRRVLLAVAAFALAGPALADEALEDARRDLRHALSAVNEISEAFARIDAGDWSGSITIEGGKIIKCGDPAKYPELGCKPYSAADKAEMHAQMAADLVEARAELAEAEAALAAREAANGRAVTGR